MLPRRGGFGEDYFGLSSTHFEGRPPKSVNFYWRRFRVADIPLANSDKFELWLRDRWYEKDALMEQYLSTGRFPATPIDAKAKEGAEGFIETEVRTKYWFEFIQIFVVIGAFGLVGKLFVQMWTNFTHIISWS